MGATNLTSKVSFQKSARSDALPVTRETSYFFDLLASDNVGAETVATHKLVTIPIGDAFVGGYLIVTKAVVGTSSTLRFSINGDTLTGLLTEANLAIGDVVTLQATDVDGTAGVEGFAVTTATTLDVAVGTATLTAGAFVLVVQTMENVTSGT